MKCEHCTRKECSKKTKTDDQENASVEVPSPAPESGEEKGEFHKLADAKIFLSDCLACDSCVSAEEGVQVAQQNAKDFLRVLNLNKKCDASEHRVLAVSVCPQSLPYFAAKFSLSVTDASRRLCGFLKSLGVHYVFDATIAADFSILESQKEFVRRFHQHSEEEPALPMLTSACPGWVRYAERVLGHPVTPHLCTARSPQQIMGSLVKDYFARRQDLSADRIFHVIVAPCYDRKLEALQEDVPTASPGFRGTDCVLTSGEIAQMMEQSDLSVRDAALDTLFGDVREEVRRHDGASSDGCLAHIFRHAAKELFDEDVGELTYRALSPLRSCGWTLRQLGGKAFLVSLTDFLSFCWCPDLDRRWCSRQGSRSVLLLPQEQRLSGGDPREEREGSPALCCRLRLPKHPERGPEAEEGQVPVPLCGGPRLRRG
uniref:Nuclear prelamin A recognition factor n=1 Tax=Sus scrofa TaxID=9823 RepID=A0A8D0VFA7_PIG